MLNPSDSPDERTFPRQRIERLVLEGRISRAAVESAEDYWHRELQDRFFQLPHGRQVQVTANDLLHLIVDPGILRRPDRILLAFSGIFAVHSSETGREIALELGKKAIRYFMPSL